MKVTLTRKVMICSPAAKIRAAELQYAQALQLELAQVFNSETLIMVIRKENLAYNCIGDADKNDDLSLLHQQQKELEDLILNVDLRIKEQADNYKKYFNHKL